MRNSRDKAARRRKRTLRGDATGSDVNSEDLDSINDDEDGESDTGVDKV